MASYTQSVREILQLNKRPDESLTDIADVYAIANRTLFAGAPINVIDNDYQQRFITGFTLHFMNEEIGYETIPLWKMALNEKIFNNYSYINKIFANLDKEIFADYTVKRIENEGSTTGSKEASGSASSERDVSVSNSSETVVDAEGTSDTVKSGSELRSRAGEDSLTKEGAELHNKKGDDKLTKSGSEYVKGSGTDTTIDENFQDSLRSTGKRQDVNNLTIQSTTPMGTVDTLGTADGNFSGIDIELRSDPIIDGDDFDDLRKPDIYELNGVDPTGSTKGFEYIRDRENKYMSSAQEVGQTTQDTEDGNEQSYSRDVNKATKGSGTLTTYGVNDAGQASPRIDQTDYNSKEDTIYGKDAEGNVSERKDTTQYGGKDVTTFGYKLDAQGDPTADERKDATTTSTDSTTTENASSTTSDDVSSSTENTESTSGTHEDTTDQTDYNINLEMLYRSIPLLNKVWEIFDDLFMLIF